MHDEASPFYVEMVDQTTRGHQVRPSGWPPAEWVGGCLSEYAPE
jgi:hypothetical protein